MIHLAAGLFWVDVPGLLPGAGSANRVVLCCGLSGVQVRVGQELLRIQGVDIF